MPSPPSSNAGLFASSGSAAAGGQAPALCPRPSRDLLRRNRSLGRTGLRGRGAFCWTCGRFRRRTG
eukprot:3383496-Lingulodinium_polyedra.AAC.1